MLDRIVDATYSRWPQGLSQHAFRRFASAEMKIAWASTHQRRYALVDGANLLASAVQYELAAVIDNQPIRVCGIGSVFTDTEHRDRGHAQSLIEHLIDQAERDGAAMALMFSAGDARPLGFTAIPLTEIEVTVLESPRRGAPMTLVRGGEERDLAAIAAIGQIRARPFRCHLDRDVAMIHHAITRQRLLAGLGPAGVRELHFFIAEEGITAAAYIVISVIGRDWTIEECGDRDGSGARVGALLQALIAREPIERRPSIRGWLPHGFRPPQVTIAPATPSGLSMMVRFLGSRRAETMLSGDEVLYWRSDVF
jgi:GNAT superfamily N-acetyltransferase